MRSKIILGVRIEDLSLKEAVEQVDKWLQASKTGLNDVNSKKQYQIFTPNPEFLVKATEDESFSRILNQSDLNPPDGVGLNILAGVKNRTPGVDLMLGLCQLAEEKVYRVGLLGGQKGVAEKTKECLLKLYPELKVIYVESGGSVAQGPVAPVSQKRPHIAGSTPGVFESSPLRHPSPPELDILFVAFGMGKQERWIAENLPNLKVKVAMGVGGSFDYISGKVKRAPLVIRMIGFEWLFRLIQQPWRIKRQLKLLKFVELILKDKLLK